MEDSTASLSFPEPGDRGPRPSALSLIHRGGMEALLDSFALEREFRVTLERRGAGPKSREFRLTEVPRLRIATFQRNR